jgi:hypothetical protein
LQSNGGKRKRSTTPEWEAAAAGGQLRAAGGVSCGEAARLYSDFTAEDLAGTNNDKLPSVSIIDQISIKTPNPECRLFLKIDQ